MGSEDSYNNLQGPLILMESTLYSRQSYAPEMLSEVLLGVF